MKKAGLLKTGTKPAPEKLVLVQGFVNTLDVETGADEISTRQSLKAWLVRHGLLRSNATVSATDLRAALSLREGLRHLLLANNGGCARPASLRPLNRLLSRYPLTVSFGTDGAARLSPARQGVAKVLGQIVAMVVQAAADGTLCRLKACDEPACRWAFFDASKNHSGRWCSMTVCGSRAKARSYRKRRQGVADNRVRGVRMRTA